MTEKGSKTGDRMTDERKDRTEAMEQLPPEELAKEIEKNKRKVARNIVFIMAAIVAFIAICIAWFVSNNRVNGTLGRISADMRSVELRTYGNTGIHDDLLKKITKSESENFWYLLENAMQGFFETSSDKYAINWLLNDTSNVGNYSDKTPDGGWETYWENPSEGVDRQDKAIEPGSSGSLTFYVVPKYDGKVELNLNLSLIPYKKAEGDQFNEITEENDKTAKDFIDGHILFFLEKGTDQKEIQWIKDGTFKIEIENAKKNEEYGYTLYWCWPQSFGEAVLQSNDSYLNGRKTLFFEFTNGEAMRNIILKTDEWSMVKNPERYFYSNLTKAPLNSGQKELKEITNMYNLPSKEFSTAAKNAFVDLSSYYNQADQYIGSHVDCVRVRLTAE